jgi:hypothetical protein
LDRSFGLLRELNLYPTNAVEPGSETFEAVCALAELEASSGHAAQGIKIYQDLSAQILGQATKPEESLELANDLSNIYRSLGRLYSFTRQEELAASIALRRTELWRHWENKLPGNSYVLRQLETKSR